jgi:hypothetical protein
VGRSVRVFYLLSGPIELLAPVALPEIPFVGFVVFVLRVRVIYPLPIERSATRTATGFLESPSNRVVPVLG